MEVGMEASTSTPLPPGGLFEIVFSFDTTGSMSSVIDEVKGRLQDMIQRLQADIPGIRFGVLAHGDYCDKDIFYLEKHIDLTQDVKQLCDFVADVDGTGGGDPEECYELVLNLVRSFSWTAGSQRALVMIGDSEPHTPEYELNEGNLDWREEAKALASMGIKIYGVQAFENATSTAFFQELAVLMSGQHLKLGNFSHVCDFIMAICYRERGEEFLEGYEAEVRAREARKALHPDLEGLFGTLKRGDSSASKTGSLRTSDSVVSGISGITAPPKLPKKLSALSSTSSTSSSSVPTAIVHPVALHPPGGGIIAKPAIAKQAIVKPAIVKGGVCKKPKKVVLPKTKETIKKIPRHTVTEKDFKLKQRNLSKRWSPWKLAMMNRDLPNKRTWLPCYVLNATIGCRRRELFKRESRSVRVLYEIAVQTVKKGKMHVMFCKYGRTNANPLNWNKGLIGKPIIARQISNALKSDCKVFVRRLVLSRLGTQQHRLIKEWRKTYSYAWSDRICVTKNKCVISS